MKDADTLANLRRAGRPDESIRECLEALAVPLHADDPVCVILDTAIADLLGHEDSMRAVHELTLQDLADWSLPRNDAEFDRAAMTNAERQAVRSIGA